MKKMTDIELLQKQKYLDLIEYLNYCRKLNESLEEYEICANIRDLVDNFSDYVLGYTENLSEDAYEFIKTHSEIEAIYTEENIVVFKWKGYFFHFEVDDKELINLLKLYECSNKKSC